MLRVQPTRLEFYPMYQCAHNSSRLIRRVATWNTPHMHLGRSS